MPYKDKEKARLNAIERKRRYRKRKHDEKYGIDAGCMMGKHGNHALGIRNGKWNNGRLISSHGYVIIRVDRDHPLRFGRCYAYEHDMVMFNQTGKMPDNEWLVHHINGNKTDNNPENLQWMRRADHAKGHRDASTGRFISWTSAGRSSGT